MATTRDHVRLAVRAAEDRKAQQILALDLRELSSVTDYFIVCNGTSDTHVRAISDAIQERLEENGQRTFGREGYQDGTWVLLDYVDFVVHIFHYEKRLYYGIEDLWADAKRVRFRGAGTPTREKTVKAAAISKKAPAKTRAAAAKKQAAAARKQSK